MAIDIVISRLKELSWRSWPYSFTVAAAASPFVNDTDVLPFIDIRSTFFGDQCNSNFEGFFNRIHCLRGQSFFT
jgi:hypothetical protein